jgi:hypothetical protein
VVGVFGVVIIVVILYIVAIFKKFYGGYIFRVYPFARLCPLGGAIVYSW